MRHLLLWLVLCVSVAWAQNPLDLLDFRFHKDTEVKRGADGSWSANWKPMGEKLTDQEADALEFVMEIVRDDAPLRKMLQSAAERMKRVRETGPLKFNKSNHLMEVAPDGKIVLVLNANMKLGRGGAWASVDFKPGQAQPCVHLPVQGIPKKGSAEHAKLREWMKRNLAETILHETDHVDTFMAEFLVDRKIWGEGSIARSSDGAHHVYSTSSNEQIAFLEGKAEAAQLVAYEQTSKLMNPALVKDDVFNGAIYGVNRAEIDYQNEALVYMMQLENGDQFAIARDLEARYDGKPIPAEEWLPLMAGEGAEHLGELKTFDALMKTEGVNALVLADLYRMNLAEPSEVTDLVEKQGIKSLQALVTHLRDVKYKAHPEMSAHVDLVFSRRTLGASADYATAAAWYRLRMTGRIDAKAHRARIDDHFRKKYPAVADVVLARNPHYTDLDRAHFVDTKPAKTPTTPTGVAAEPEVDIPTRPADRVRARLAGGGTRLMLHAGGSMGMALSVSVVMSSIADVIKGKTAPSDLGELMKVARRQLADPSFVTMTIAGMGIEEGAEKGGEMLLVRFLTSRGAQQAARQACAKMKVGGVVVSVVAGLIANQVLAHDWSFLDCNNLSGKEKARRIFKAIFTDFSGWDKKAVLDVVLGTVGFAAAAAIVIASGGSALLVMGAGIVVGFAATYVSGWLAQKWDELEYRHTKDTVKWALEEFSKNDPKVNFPVSQIFWLRLEASDRAALEGAVNLDAKRHTIAQVLGRIGEKGTPRFTCEGEVVDKTRGVASGVFKDFFDKREKFMNNVVGELNEYVDSHQKRMEEATTEYVTASAPTAGGLDLRRLAVLFSHDRRYRPLAIDSVADLILTAVRANPKLESDPGAQEKATDDQIDALHQRYVDQIKPVLTGDPIQLARDHIRAIEELEGNTERAYRRFSDQREAWETEVKGKIAKFVKQLEEQIGQERADVTATDLKAIEPYNPELLKFLEQRARELEGTVRGYRELYKLQETAPRSPEDEGLQAYRELVEDWTAPAE